SDARIVEREPDAALHRFGIGRGHAAAAAVAAAVEAGAGHLGVDPRPSFARALLALEQEHAGARRRDEAGRRTAHRARGELGRVVVGAAQHAHRVEAGPDIVALPLGATA